MRYKNLTPREKKIYQQGKIAGYYKHKAEQKKAAEANKSRYGSFNANEAFNKALSRSYGDSFKTR